MFEDEYEECPECGEKQLDVLETREYSEGVLMRKTRCQNQDCGHSHEEKIRALKQEDKKRCANCNAEYMPDGYEKFCGHCQENKVFHNVYAHNFGILVPGNTGVVYEQQTAGVACRHVHIEGSFIPLRKPRKTAYGDDEELDEFYKFDSEYRKDGDLLTRLRRANYNYADEETLNRIWNDIRKELDFKFNLLDRDEIPDNTNPQEGIRWVKITEAEEKLENLEGRKVCLVYPNCD